MAQYTGDPVTTPGIYSSDCHEKKVAVGSRECFPGCPSCRRPAGWRLVAAVGQSPSRR